MTPPRPARSPARDLRPAEILRHPLFTRLLLPTAILAFYFLVPVGSAEAPVGLTGGVVMGAGCFVLVGWAVLQEFRRAQRLLPVHLILVLELALVVFALTYYGMAIRNPEEFSGLHTRLDGLYFSMTTMSTVGYGDVHATGQTGRMLVTIQLAFNLVFVGGLIALIQEQVRERRRQTRPAGPGTDQNPARGTGERTGADAAFGNGSPTTESAEQGGGHDERWEGERLG